MVDSKENYKFELGVKELRDRRGKVCDLQSVVIFSNLSHPCFFYALFPLI